jgi:rfaE bifunctional protein kinase chain/domain
MLFDTTVRPRIVVLGDLILDHYLSGKAERISPEAPVPVILHETEEYRLGGAANVALNLLALGCEPLLMGLIGQDYFGQRILDLLQEQGLSSEGVLCDTKRQTTCKTRILARGQQLLRYDREDRKALSEELELDLLHKLEKLFERKLDCLVFQDYNKGLLQPRLIAKAIELAKQYGIPTVVDPKKDHFLAYRGVTLFKPNLKEVNEALGFSIQEQQPDLLQLQEAAGLLEANLEQEYTMITLGAKGLYLKRQGEQGRLYPTRPRLVADVCGAGDTVVSVAAWALASGFEAEKMAVLANLAGGQVCERLGVVPVDALQLEREYKQGEQVLTI